jgi:HD-GYP domain-containing protein (c-di-GMP phosphodiesterase class II)
MTFSRPYKASLSKEEALKEIKNCSGTQFDKHIAKIFIKIMEEKKVEGK